MNAWWIYRNLGFNCVFRSVDNYLLKITRHYKISLNVFWIKKSRSICDWSKFSSSVVPFAKDLLLMVHQVSQKSTISEKYTFSEVIIKIKSGIIVSYWCAYCYYHWSIHACLSERRAGQSIFSFGTRNFFSSGLIHSFAELDRPSIPTERKLFQKLFVSNL